MATAKINKFEIATRTKLRFTSTRGPLSIEQLWEVPLRSGDGFNLNLIAKAVNKELESVSEDNFVDTEKDNPNKIRLQLAFDLVKYVIETKLDEENVEKERAANRVKKQKLLKALQEKEDGELSELSKREIQKQLDELAVD